MGTMAEIYVPDLHKTCSLRNMTIQRFDHSQNGWLSCGGGSRNTIADWSYETCDLYVPGVGWRKEPYTLNTRKSEHTSWTFKNGSVLLLGSFFDDNETDLVTPGVGSVPGFYLNNPIKYNSGSWLDHFVKPLICSGRPVAFRTPEMSISTSLATERKTLEIIGTRWQSLVLMDSLNFCPI